MNLKGVYSGCIVQSNIAALLMWTGDLYTHLQPMWNPSEWSFSEIKMHKELTDDHIWTTALEGVTTNATNRGSRANEGSSQGKSLVGIWRLKNDMCMGQKPCQLQPLAVQSHAMIEGQRATRLDDRLPTTWHVSMYWPCICNMLHIEQWPWLHANIMVCVACVVTKLCVCGHWCVCVCV